MKIRDAVKRLFGGDSGSATPEIPPDPPDMSRLDSMMNAAANVLAYEQKDRIEFMREGGGIAGIWVHGFPGNTMKRDFLAMFCAGKRQHEAHARILAGHYRISRAAGRGGFDVVFEYLAPDTAGWSNPSSRVDTKAAATQATDVSPPENTAEISHDFDARDVCVRCGCSRGGVRRFGFRCEVAAGT